MKLVIIDPGHGGRDSGACANNLKEASLVRSIVVKIIDKLASENHLLAKTSFCLAGKSCLTDTWGINNRKAFLRQYNHNNSQKIDYLVSIHLNAYAKALPCGLVVCYNGNLEDARVMYDSMIFYAKETPYFKEKGYFLAGNREQKLQERKNLAILNTTISSLLVEAGFITNPNEQKILKSEEGQQIIAYAIVDGIYNLLER